MGGEGDRYEIHVVAMLTSNIVKIYLDYIFDAAVSFKAQESLYVSNKN